MSASRTNILDQARHHWVPLTGFVVLLLVVIGGFLWLAGRVTRHSAAPRNVPVMINDQTGRKLHFGTPEQVAPQPTLPQVPSDQGYGQQGYGEVPTPPAQH